MLTKRQKQILDFIRGYIKENSYAPTLEEIAENFGLSSIGTVAEHLENLEAKGYLKREDNQPRSIDLLEGEPMVQVPLLGLISAGQPMEAIEDKETIAVLEEKLPKSGNFFALKVTGNSMVDENINDGDIVLVKEQKTAENGQRVVALVDNYNTTLKKFYREKGYVRLQPANKGLEPVIIKRDREFDIQGIVIDVIKTGAAPKPIRYEHVRKDKKLQVNKIICGDVLEVMRELPDDSIHLAITSPPYNVGKDYDNHDDKMESQEHINWLYEVWKETKRVLIPGGRFALNIAPTGIRDFVPLHHDFTNQMRNLGMKFRTEIIWYKQTMLKRTAWGSFKSPSNPHIVPSWEYILVFSKDKDKLDGNPKMADITREEFMKFSDGFWQIQPETKRKGHPAPFPEELIYRLTKYYSYKGNVVLDMFGGTGTVAVIAARTGRDFIHIDVSKQYCEVAQERLDKEIRRQKLL